MNRYLNYEPAISAFKKSTCVWLLVISLQHLLLPCIYAHVIYFIIRHRCLKCIRHLGSKTIQLIYVYIFWNSSERLFNGSTLCSSRDFGIYSEREHKIKWKDVYLYFFWVSLFNWPIKICLFHCVSGLTSSLARDARLQLGRNTSHVFIHIAVKWFFFFMKLRH